MQKGLSNKQNWLTKEEEELFRTGPGHDLATSLSRHRRDRELEKATHSAVDILILH